MPNKTNDYKFTKDDKVSYMNGNTVKKLQTLPDKQHEVIKKENERSRQIRRNRERALSMNAGSVAFLALAVCITLIGCVKYLTLQAEITERMNYISSLDSELSDLKSDNDETYNRINASLDLDEIKRIAIDELGMVYASQDQVVLYDNQESDYVRQFDDIPESNSND